MLWNICVFVFVFFFKYCFRSWMKLCDLLIAIFGMCLACYLKCFQFRQHSPSFSISLSFSIFFFYFSNNDGLFCLQTPRYVESLLAHYFRSSNVLSHRPNHTVPSLYVVRCIHLCQTVDQTCVYRVQMKFMYEYYTCECLSTDTFNFIYGK